MLKTLIKYELKATSRWFVPIYVLALLLSPLERFTVGYMEKGIHLNSSFDRIVNTVFFLINFAFGITLVAIGIASGILIIYRFYKNLITSEGYLMHTLPVKTSQLIWSKAIAGILWSLASIVVICLAIFFLVVGTHGWNNFTSMVSEAVSALLQDYGTGARIFKLILEGIAAIIICSLSSIFMLYAAIALGQLVTKHKIFGAFGAYFVMNMAVQTLLSLLALPLFSKLGNSINIASAEEAIDTCLNVFFPLGILIAAGLATAFYFITSYIFKNRLNLE